jgi:ATP-dependent Clp protease ATP-binding subunit ClpC
MLKTHLRRDYYSKISSGDEIFMDIEEGAQELSVKVNKAG